MSWKSEVFCVPQRSSLTRCSLERRPWLGAWVARCGQLGLQQATVVAVLIDHAMFQWESQDPKMKVLYHIRPYFLGIFSCIGLIYRRYLQFRSWNRSWNGHWLFANPGFSTSSHLQSFWRLRLPANEPQRCCAPQWAGGLSVVSWATRAHLCQLGPVAGVQRTGALSIVDELHGSFLYALCNRHTVNLESAPTFW